MKNTNLIQALGYLQEVLRKRLGHYLGKTENTNEPFELPRMVFEEDDEMPFTRFVMEYRLTTEELITLLLVLVPNVFPQFFDSVISEFLPDGGDFPQFGGVKINNHRGMIPTGETVLFVLAGDDPYRRFEIQQIFKAGHFFEKEKILTLEQVKPGDPFLSGRLIMDPEYIELFTTGTISLPRLSTAFPAEHITTLMEWDDLVLNDATLSQLRELEVWIKHNDTLLYNWGMHKKIKPGYRALFYGPPGTGKTLAASLLGKYTGREVFKIDLSMVVSKYIGETEKNLATLFDKAQNKDWILFFDEADSIFGKRTDVRDAHDKYANQEVSYLLQRIEGYPGLTILASNFRSNIDEAFLRRFNAVIYFPIPKPEERLRLWRNAFPMNVKFADDVKLKHFAQKFELTGSHIMNIVHHTCLGALDRNTIVITANNIQEGIEKEYAKEGKIL